MQSQSTGKFNKDLTAKVVNVTTILGQGSPLYGVDMRGFQKIVLTIDHLLPELVTYRFVHIDGKADGIVYDRSEEMHEYMFNRFNQAIFGTTEIISTASISEVGVEVD
jgi:hypothetical protein